MKNFSFSGMFQMPHGGKRVRCILAGYLKIIGVLLAGFFVFQRISLADPSSQTLAPRSQVHDDQQQYAKIVKALNPPNDSNFSKIRSALSKLLKTELGILSLRTKILVWQILATAKNEHVKNAFVFATACLMVGLAVLSGFIVDPPELGFIFCFYFLSQSLNMMFAVSLFLERAASQAPEKIATFLQELSHLENIKRALLESAGLKVSPHAGSQHPKDITEQGIKKLLHLESAL